MKIVISFPKLMFDADKAPALLSAIAGGIPVERVGYSAPRKYKLDEDGQIEIAIVPDSAIDLPTAILALNQENSHE